jgi:hypothetical protein
MYRGQPIYHPQAGGLDRVVIENQIVFGWPRRSTTMPCWSAPTVCARSGRRAGSEGGADVYAQLSPSCSQWTGRRGGRGLAADGHQ